MPESRFRTREIALKGRLRTADDPATIAPEDLSVCKNMRPSDQYPRGVGGMTKINTSALASTGIRNGFHFRKAQPSESHVMAWTSDGKVWKNDTAIPSAGSFAAAVWNDAVGGSTGRFANGPDGALVYANGVDTCAWGGAEHRCAGFIDFPAAGKVYNYSDFVTNTLVDSDHVATIHAESSGGSHIATTYIGSVLPLDAFKLYMATVNSVAATLEVKYWDGTAWVAVTNLVDGTVTVSTPLSKTGTISFDTTENLAKTKAIEKINLYWYQMTVTASATFAPTISQVTVSIPFQKMLDIWDGDKIPLATFRLFQSSDGKYYDYTTQVLENFYDATDATSFASLIAMGGSDYLYFGSMERLSGVMISLADNLVSLAAGTMKVDYWNGSAWTALSIIDGTFLGSSMLGKSGWVTWQPPAQSAEFKQSDIGNIVNDTQGQSIGGGGQNPIVGRYADTALYYYRLGVATGATTASVAIYHASGIPVQRDIRGYSFPLLHQNSVVLCANMDGNKNSILKSAPNTVNTFNGLESFEWFFGDDAPIVAASSLFLRFGSSVQDMLVLCKQSEVHILEGNGSDNDPYRTRLLCENIGCIAPLTMVTIPVGDLGSGVRRQIAIWESQRGIEVFDGASLMDPLLSYDIRDKFDPLSANYAGSPSNTGFYDSVLDEYHWVVAGSAEWVFSFKHKKWYQIDRGSGKYLYGGIPVLDTSGNSYVYGFLNTGYLERLENGTDFDGNDIVHTLKTGSIALAENKISEETTLRMVKVVQVAKTTANSMSVTHYGDTATSGNSIGSYVPSATGKRLSSRILNAGSKGPHVHHEFQLSLTTNDQTYGCEPIYIVAYYDGERQDVR